MAFQILLTLSCSALVGLGIRAMKRDVRSTGDEMTDLSEHRDNLNEALRW